MNDAQLHGRRIAQPARPSNIIQPSSNKPLTVRIVSSEITALHKRTRAMDRTARERRLLFVNADTSSLTTRRRSRSKALDSRIRRHLMADIGISRRKPPKTPQAGTVEWSLQDPPEAADSTGRAVEQPTDRDEHRLHVPVKTIAAPGVLEPRIAATPILDALSVFEREWGEDRFSAYGFTLIMVAGRNATRSGEEPPDHPRGQHLSLTAPGTKPARQTRSGSPSPSDNLPSSTTTDRSSPRLTSSSPCTAGPSESCDPWPWSARWRPSGVSSRPSPAVTRAPPRLIGCSMRCWRWFATT
jgi:hypothetical protein